MNMMLATASMLNATARDWPGAAIHDISPPEINHRKAPPRPRYGGVKLHQRAAAKRRSRKRARQLKHF
ncbi:hypothetical protein RSO41_06165 [Halomonas sp. I1]|nr:hypothetical protein [Halomonas sp. I1]